MIKSIKEKRSIFLRGGQKRMNKQNASLCCLWAEGGCQNLFCPAELTIHWSIHRLAAVSKVHYRVHVAAVAKGDKVVTWSLSARLEFFLIQFICQSLLLFHWEWGGRGGGGGGFCHQPRLTIEKPRFLFGSLVLTFLFLVFLYSFPSCWMEADCLQNIKSILNILDSTDKSQRQVIFSEINWLIQLLMWELWQTPPPSTFDYATFEKVG